MEVITKDMEEVKAYFEALERGTKYVDNVTANFHPVMSGEVYLTGEEVCRILHITTRTLQGATDYPVHFVAGQNTVPTIGLVAYAGRELCADEAKEQTKEKLYLTFGCGAWVNAAKAGTSKRNSCLCRVLHFPEGIRRFHAWRPPAAC